MVKMDVVCLSFNRAVFVLQNSLPLWGWTVYFYDIAAQVDIPFYQLYTDLRHEKFTKRYDIWQTFS